MAFNYVKTLEKLEAIAESRTMEHFSGVWTIVLALLRSRYFLIALCFYAVLLMVLAGVVISHYVAPPPFAEGRVLVLPPSGGAPPAGPRGAPETEAQKAAQQSEVPVSVQSMSSRMAARTAASSLTIAAPSDFVRLDMPMAAPLVQMSDVKVDTEMTKSIAEARIKHLAGVRDFQKGWNVTMGRGTMDAGLSTGRGPGIKGVGKAGKYHNVRAQFVIFQAKYQDGDWDCNGGAGTNLWEHSALRNLMFQIRQWSSDRIDAHVVPVVLDIGTDELFTLKPPFVYLTGHKDFHFLDQEVTNLYDYLMVGGCVWADSALAGRRSRFDLAFRREMKRVLPDRDFELVPPDHEMFNTFFAKVDLPSGMNFYQEPVEVINIGDELAVLYTLNGYGHFWETRLNREGNIEWGLVNLGMPGRPVWTHVYGPHLGDGITYRNINNDTVRENYKFGINVVVHLLTRYQKHFRFLPKELPKIDMRGLQEKKIEETQLDETEDKTRPKRVHKKLGDDLPSPVIQPVEKEDGK